MILDDAPATAEAEAPAKRKKKSTKKAAGSKSAASKKKAGTKSSNGGKTKSAGSSKSAAAAKTNKSKGKGGYAPPEYTRGLSVAVDQIKVTKQFDIRDNLGDTKELEGMLATNGLNHPILLRAPKTSKGKYELLSGHRRLQAAKNIGWETIDASSIPAETPDDQCLMIVVGENSEGGRSNLSPVEEGKVFDKLHKDGLTYETIGSQVGYSGQVVRMRVMVATTKLKGLQEMVLAGELPQTTVEHLAQLDPKTWRKVKPQIMPGATLSDVKRIIKEVKADMAGPSSDGDEDEDGGGSSPGSTRSSGSGAPVGEDVDDDVPVAPTPMTCRTPSTIRNQMERVVQDIAAASEEEDEASDKAAKKAAKDKVDRLSYVFATLNWVTQGADEISVKSSAGRLNEMLESLDVEDEEDDVEDEEVDEEDVDDDEVDDEGEDLEDDDEEDDGEE